MRRGIIEQAELLVDDPIGYTVSRRPSSETCRRGDRNQMAYWPQSKVVSNRPRRLDAASACVDRASGTP